MQNDVWYQQSNGSGHCIGLINPLDTVPSSGGLVSRDSGSVVYVAYVALVVHGILFLFIEMEHVWRHCRFSGAAQEHFLPPVAHKTVFNPIFCIPTD